MKQTELRIGLVAQLVLEPSIDNRKMRVQVSTGPPI